MGVRGEMRLCVTWIIVGLLTVIVLSNLIAIYNIIKLFIFNKSKIKSATILTTTQKYGNSHRTSTRIYVTNGYHESSPSKKSDDAKHTERTTMKHRRRYKFDKKLGKYVRIRKLEHEKSSYEQEQSFTQPDDEMTRSKEVVLESSEIVTTSDDTTTFGKRLLKEVPTDIDDIGTPVISVFSSTIDPTTSANSTLTIPIFSTPSVSSIAEISSRTAVSPENLETTVAPKMMLPDQQEQQQQQQQRLLPNSAATKQQLSQTETPSSLPSLLSSLLLPSSSTPSPSSIPSTVAGKSLSLLIASSSSPSPSSLLSPTSSMTSPSSSSSPSTIAGKSLSSSITSSASSSLSQSSSSSSLSFLSAVPLPPSSSIASHLSIARKRPGLSKISIAPSDHKKNSLDELNNDIIILKNAVEDFVLPQTRQSTNHNSGSTLIEVHKEAMSPTPRIASLPSSSSTRTVIHPRRYFPKFRSRERVSGTPRPKLKTLQKTASTTQRVTLSGFTLVTALLDIGRGDWWEYRRPLQSYYMFMENLLRLRVNLIIFVDQKSVQHVFNRRKYYRLEHMTKIIPITLGELPLYRYMSAISAIIASEQSGERWDPQWDRVMSTHPEAKSAEYDILVNSKSYFLLNASMSNPFLSEHFAWLDAGYAHGNQSVFPPSFRWYPNLVPRKVSVIKVTPPHDSIFRYTLADLYRKNWAVVSGGFLGGDIYTLYTFHHFYHRVVVDMIYRGLIDDDQTTLVLLIQQIPELFNVVHGDWFDALRLF